MTRKFYFSQDAAQLFYLQYKDIILSSLVIVVCFVLMLWVIFPQIQEWFSLKDEESQYQQRIGILKQNITFLTGLNNQSLDSEVQLATTALPSDKDYLGVLQSISDTAIISRVAIGDYGFQVGELSAKPVLLSERPSLKILLTVGGDLPSTKIFIKELSQRFPLAEVTSIETTGQASTLTILFYFKNYSSDKVDDTVAIRPVSAGNKQLLAQLQTWQVEIERTRAFATIPKLIPAGVAVSSNSAGIATPSQ